MAILIPSALVSRMSGNIGGVNFVATKGASVARLALRAGKKTTPGQQDRTARVSRSVWHWNKLPSEIRVQWQRFAENQRIPNRLGVHTTIPAYSLYVAHALDSWNGDPPANLTPPAVVIHLAPDSLDVHTEPPHVATVTQHGAPMPEGDPQLTARIWLHRFARPSQVSGFNNPRVIATIPNPPAQIDLAPLLAARDVTLQDQERIGLGIDWRWADNTYGQITWAGHTVSAYPPNHSHPEDPPPEPEPAEQSYEIGDQDTQQGQLWPKAGDPEEYRPSLTAFVSPDGGTFYLFATTTGTLKMHIAIPTSDASGEVVGTQF